MSHNKGLAKTSMLIETRLFLTSVERYIEALNLHRGIVVTEKFFEMSAGELIEKVYPQACGLLNSLESNPLLSEPGKFHLKQFFTKLKKWGLM